MYQLRQSATGQFVLVHPATETVVVADDLREAYDRMRALTGELPAGEPAVVVKSATPSSGQGAKLAVLAVLVLLPFVWLGALHVSLGRLVAELRSSGNKQEPSADEVRTRLERLELRIDQQDSGERRGPPRNRPPRTVVPEPEPAPAATPTTAAAPADDDETGDEG